MGLCPGGRLRRIGVYGREGHYGYSFRCPGCESSHVIYHVAAPEGCRNWPVWTFNGNEERPTFQPSLLVRWTDHSRTPPFEHVCHSFITDGRIQFLTDCTHPLKGQTVEIPQHDDQS